MMFYNVLRNDRTLTGGREHLSIVFPLAQDALVWRCIWSRNTDCRPECSSCMQAAAIAVLVSSYQHLLVDVEQKPNLPILELTLQACTKNTLRTLQAPIKSDYCCLIEALLFVALSSFAASISHVSRSLQMPFESCDLHC